jgi:hypothetical protein
MEIKLFEVRDRMTFIPFAVIKAGSNNNFMDIFLLSFAGHVNSFFYYCLESGVFTDDYESTFNKSRTYYTASKYITEHWDDLASGSVIDVQYILGETSTVVASDFYTFVKQFDL